MNERILLIEDEVVLNRSLKKILEKEGFVIENAFNGEEGLQMYRSNFYHLVLSDFMMPRRNGLEVLKEIKKTNDQQLFILMTAFGTVENAVEAMANGACDYIIKSADIKEIIIKVKKALEFFYLKQDLNFFREREAKKASFLNIVGESPKMQKVFERINEVGMVSGTTVLILGESGTGKELVAKAIHNLSPRKNKPLIELNCSAIPLNLLESELFGHEKGSFTNADYLKIGLIELANGGTLFLDEIGDMDLTLQSKILRVLQERKIRRVGGTKDLDVDVRFIAATNRNLDELINEKRFREDLYYRLKVFTIEMPPLRERKKDVKLLVDHFIKYFNKEFSKHVISAEDDFVKILEGYKFPGNVRELRNLIEQAMILTKGSTIKKDLLPERLFLTESLKPEVIFNKENFTFTLNLELGKNRDVFEFLEKKIIAEVLNTVKFNQTKASELLGISRHALKRRLKKFEI